MQTEETTLRRFWRLHFTFFANWQRKFNRTRLSGTYHTRELPYHGNRYRNARQRWIYANGFPQDLVVPHQGATPGYVGPRTNKRRYIAKQRRLRVT